MFKLKDADEIDWTARFGCHLWNIINDKDISMAEAAKW